MKTQQSRLHIWTLLILVSMVLVINVQAQSTLDEPLTTPDRYYVELERQGSSNMLPASHENIPINSVDALPGRYRLVFDQSFSGNWEIILYPFNTPQWINLSNHPDADIHPRLDLGCNRLVFASNRTGNFELYLLNFGDMKLTQLTYTDQDDVFPAWSPNGTMIVFQSYRDGQSEIYVMLADGTIMSRLTFDDDYDGQPAWSPDSQKIAFVSRRTGGYRIWVMNADGSDQIQLSNQPYSENPVWSPDGSMISYDADGDSNNWQDLWIMNGDGTDQRLAISPSEINQDYLVHSWTPNGKHVVFTGVKWIQYNGNWYWLEAGLLLYDWQGGGPPSGVVGNFGIWDPDIRSVDIFPPETVVQALPSQSPWKFVLNWMGSDAGEAGIKSYDIQVRESMSWNWQDWFVQTPITSAEYTGLGGSGYYFRARAIDHDNNLEDWTDGWDAYTFVENLPPKTTVASMERFTTPYPVIAWGGVDPGGSGILSYDIQYRKEESETWTDWFMDTVQTSAIFSQDSGHTYYYRVRARDNAQNLEFWPVGGFDTQTTIYDLGVTGVLHDNTGTPIISGSIVVSPTAFTILPSDKDGNYGAYVATHEKQLQVNWSKVGYGELSNAIINFIDPGTFTQDVTLPPLDDQIINGGFELPNDSRMADWDITGIYTPQIISNNDWIVHSGNRAILLGEAFAFESPTRISDESAKASTPKIESAPDGSQHMIWRSRVNENFVIYYSIKQPGQVWSPPQEVDLSVEDFIPTYPDLKIDSSGQVHVVWNKDDWNGLSESQFCYRKRLVDGTWTNIECQETYDFDYPDVKMIVAPDGNIHFIWKIRNVVISYLKRSPSGTWSKRELVFDSDESIYGIVFLLDKQNGLHLNWVLENGMIYYAYRPDGGSWSVNMISPAYLGEVLSNFTLDNEGKPHIIWQQCPPNGPQPGSLYYVHQRNDDSWSKAIVLAQKTLCSSYSTPQIAIGYDNRIHLVWEQITPGGPTDLYYRSGFADSEWSPSANISKTDGNSKKPMLRLETDGHLYLIWLDESLGDWRIYFAQLFPETNIWQKPVPLPGTSYPALYYSLSIDYQSVPHIAWVDQRFMDGEGVLFYSIMQIPEQNGTSMISQKISLPTTMTTPVLSFYYGAAGVSPDTGKEFRVLIQETTTSTLVFSTTANMDYWKHEWLDLSAWVGKCITISFEVKLFPGQPPAHVFLDEISLGSTQSDIWVEVPERHSAYIAPGSLVTYTIYLGNKGGALAKDIEISLSLKGNWSYVRASITPVDATTLRWELGNLPSKSEVNSLDVTLLVAPDAIAFQHLEALVLIESQNIELEMANNLSRQWVIVAYSNLLPIIIFGYGE